MYYKNTDRTTLYLTNIELHNPETSSSILDILEQNITNNSSLTKIVFTDETISQMRINPCISIKNQIDIIVSRDVSVNAIVENIMTQLINWKPQYVTSNNVSTFVTNDQALAKFVYAVND